MPSKFQKRHYITIAETLHRSMPDYIMERKAWGDVVNSFIAMLAADNGNFQPSRFNLACEEGISAKGVGAGIQGGPATPYFQGNTPMDSGAARSAARQRRNR